MKHSKRILSVLRGCTALAAVQAALPVFAAEATQAQAQTASGTGTVTTPFYTSGITFGDGTRRDGVSIRKTTGLYYNDSRLCDSYRISNSSDKELSVTIVAPQITTLCEAFGEPLYDFSLLLDDESGNALDYESAAYFTPFFSANGLSETSLSVAQLTAAKDRSVSIPDEEGVLYAISRSGGDSSVCLSLSVLSDNCHIYPLGCSYTTTENGYELSVSEDCDFGYVFLTGAKEKDFTLDETDPSAFSVSSEDSSLEAFLSLCCSQFLDEHPEASAVTEELLMTDLGEYFGRSSVTVSLDLLPTIEWISEQKRFRVYDYCFTVPAGSTVIAEIGRTAALQPSETVLYPMLALDSLIDLETDSYLYAQLPQGYSSMAIQQTANKKQKDSPQDGLTYAVTRYKEPTCKVVLFKTPAWSSTLKYLPVFIVVMAVFMGLCLISYLTTRRRRQPSENSSDSAGKQR